ncbi:MAG: hypothetical protein RLZZ28_156 [Bacteroidota bacterium]
MNLLYSGLYPVKKTSKLGISRIVRLKGLLLFRSANRKQYYHLVDAFNKK